MKGEAELYNEIFRDTQLDDDCCSGSAWLVGRDRGSGLEYLGDNWMDYTKDPNRALRLCRRRDAAAVCYAVGSGRPVQHYITEGPTYQRVANCDCEGVSL